MTALLRYDAACQAIAEAKTVDEVSEWVDKAAAVREYGRRIRNRQLEIDAIEIRVRAKKRRGELLLALKEQGRLREGRKKLSSADDSFSLDDLGLSRNESSEEQAIAKIEGNAFERLVARCRAYAEQHPEKHAFNVLKPPPEGGPVNGSRAIMGSRQEPDDSLDYFPTPPWATRALFETVMPAIGVDRFRSVWEPACGEGHIAEVAREYCPTVHASDVFDYGYGGVADFLTMTDHPNADWIVTNPPFGDLALQFVDRALGLANLGVAMFFRSQWAVEGIERYETIFRDRPPTLCAFFVERVNLCKGRWEPDGSTATAYCWLVWKRDLRPFPPFWIPPGRRDALTKPDDRERFTTHPVTARVVCDEPFDKDTGEIAEAPAPAAPANPEPKPEDDLSIPPFLLRVPKGEAVA